MKETTREKYRKLIKLLGPKRIKALTEIYEKHGNFYIYFGRLREILENPKQTKYTLDDAIVFPKKKKKKKKIKKSVRKKRRIE
ncbi:MAG: hypothetical protein ACHQNT_07120 [Bacteroidia bacterium]